MSKTNYILCDFIVTIPSCEMATTLNVVLEMFSQGQSDRVVVLDRQQYPIGVVQLRRLMPQLIQLSKNSNGLDLPPNLTQIGVELVEPVGTLPADLNVEKFQSYLDSQQQQKNIDCEWALIDGEGKYIGLLDSSRLWKFLASPLAASNQEHGQHLVQMPQSGIEPYKLDLLVQMLERLPIPLMLQTGIGEVITQNPAWCQQFGALSEPEAVRQEVEAILNTGDRRQETEDRIIPNSEFTPLEDSTTPLSHCQLGNQPGTCICTWSGHNGSERVWQFIKIPLLMSQVSNQPQNEQIWVLLANDVTEQQQMASELAAKNADLILLNRLKDEFLACISHELRTPLTAMMGLSALLKDQALGKLNERQARYARLIHENGRHLMSVVNDILDLTRMETGQLELTLEPVKIRKVCDRAIDQAKAAIAPKNSPATGTNNNSTEHRFTLSIKPGLETMVADELRLRQMLVHLLANAFKFTEVAGEIGLRVSYWAGWIAFTVWDTGIGIPEHKQHLIFQKFQQLENPLTRQFEGTGLGLVLTRALARMHGGDVSFLSQEGKGSQFTLLLPPSPPNKRAGGAGEAGEAGGAEGQRSSGAEEQRGKGAEEKFQSLIQNPKSKIQNRSSQLVLVVEAAPRFIEDLADQLTSIGYWVVIARSGTEALEKARRLQPGVIFLNPLLPLLSGWDVLTLIKSDAVTHQIPVIVTTTRAEKDQAISNRADEFLTLPVKRQVLQKLMTRFCGSPSVSRTGNLPRRINNDSQLTILRLTHPSHLTPLDLLSLEGTQPSSFLKEEDERTGREDHPSILNYRVLEADDLEQAALLARIWQPDVVLLDGVILDPPTYLQQLVQYPTLAELPLVTLDAATVQAAKQISELCVFPCLTATPRPPMHVLSSVLQMAAGISCDYSVLVVDVAQPEGMQQVDFEAAAKHSSLPRAQSYVCNHDTHTANGAYTGAPIHPHPSHTLRAEWLQALIQYLHTAGFRGVMAHSWEQVQQQIHQQSVDLILICLGESKQALSVLAALTQLQQYKLPPVIVMERQFSRSEVREQFPHYLEGDGQDFPSSYFFEDELNSDTRTQTDDWVDSASNLSLATVESDKSLDDLRAIATKILPSSLSMEELLDNIYQTLQEGR